MTTLKQAYLDKGKNYIPRTRHIDAQGRAKFVNHLILESSPYLLQHAHNPVNWYGFSDEAFDKAKREHKPVFISIGYATCHWCHVMEEESFDDTTVADFLNKHFVSIKVDREIRPDVDAAYMNIAQLMNGSGGWPLNAILLPDGRAFFAGTYFPQAQLLRILQQVQKLWVENNNKLRNQAHEIDKVLKKNQTYTKNTLNKNIVATAIKSLLDNFDEFEGGFGEAPKFPHESMLLLLIDEQKRHPNPAQLNAITTTLDNMVSGGFFDVVGGGFHRYATDNAWLLPHFEKMLYNQAQLALVYTRAYQLTQKPLYKSIAEQTLAYVLREMQAPQGGFFSATDADSEGEEGTFFVWSDEQLRAAFNAEEFNIFQKWFDLSSNSEFENAHIIRFKNPNRDSNNAQITKLLAKLYRLRLQRKPPLTDYKVLLSWNALLVPAFIEAGANFNAPKYTRAGIKLAHYLQSFHANGKWYRARINDKLQTLALFEDYAYLANAYLSVFDQNGEKIWLDSALALTKEMREKFWDQTHFGFNIAQDSKYIDNTYKESYDGALPSANAVAYQVLLKLEKRTNEGDFKTQTKQLLTAFSNEINQNPYHHSSFILGFNNATNQALSNVQYAYNGRIRIHSHYQNQALLIDLQLAPSWHINANKPLQDSLIATKISNLDTQNWKIKNITYPIGKMLKLGISKEKISVYQNQIQIKTQLTQQTQTYLPPSLELSLQACSDKVCLPPTTIILKPFINPQ